MEFKLLVKKALQSLIEPMINILISAAKQVADLFVKGEELTVFQKKLIVLAFFAGHLFYKETVDSTETAYDNKAMDEALDLFLDTGKEGDFDLVYPPDFDEPEKETA